jgi:alpha-glucosidase
MTSYQEPSPSFRSIEEIAALPDGSIDLVDTEGTTLQISHLKGIGWCFESRLDLTRNGAFRQPFTGDQAHLPKTALETRDSGPICAFEAEGQLLRLDRNGAGFELVEAGRVIFRSGEAPFSHHETPVKLWEGVMSLKVTDFSTRAPQIPQGSQFESRMVRFAYSRPSGVVLGLPGQTGELNRSGYRFELYNTDEFVHTPARKPMYQSWPVLIHKDHRGEGWVGVFFDNPSRTFVDVGDFYSDRVTFEAIDNNQRIYFCTAPSLEEVSRKLSLLFGGQALPPAWAFGYQQSRWSYMSTAEIRKVAAAFREREIPCDALHFDIDYMDGYRVFTQHPEHFKDLRPCLDELHTQGFHAVAIADPGVKMDPEYPVYRAFSKAGSVLRTQDAKPFVAKVWPGEVVLPDFGSPRAREIWSDLQAAWLTAFPFDGIWNDMNEPSNFDGQNATTSQTSTERGDFRRESNLYGYWMAKASAEGVAKAQPGRRAFIISRSGYPGVQKAAVNWQGDNQAWWEHLRLAIETTLQYALCGSYYSGADVPGFTGNPPDDLAVRFFQLGSWLPFFRGHSIYFAKDKEPYAYGDDANALIKAAIYQRYSLAREWYSGFERSTATSTPPILPVFTSEGHLVRDEFLVFDKFLIAPVIERDAIVRSFYLPKGVWYRLGDPALSIPGDRWQLMPVSLSDLPVFVRGGSVLTRNAPRSTMGETLGAPERYEIYRDANGQAEGYWYDDDLVSSHPTSVQRRALRVGKGVQEVSISQPASIR